jgi:hypothetical protein
MSLVTAAMPLIVDEHPHPSQNADEYCFQS